ncbi:InlB B-repeat-containing protein [Cohnella hashimotonis]
MIDYLHVSDPINGVKKACYVAKGNVEYYSTGAATGSAPTDSNSYEVGATVTVLDQGGLERPGFIFAGWNTMWDGTGTLYPAGTTFTMGNANIRLYDWWKWGEPAASVYSGTGTANDPFQIATPLQLDKLRNYFLESGLYFKLTADLDLSDYQSGAGWEPIGGENTPFRGNLDGNGHKITNLFMDRSAGFTGLFGFINNENASVTNLKLVDVNIKGSNYVGGLAGWNSGTMSNIYVTGSITGVMNTGGLAGGSGGAITNSYVAGSITGSYTTGGFVGQNYGPIDQSYHTGSITGTDSVGGLVGENNAPISNSYHTGSITGTNTVGGLVGDNYAPIDKSYAAGSVTGSSAAGGLVGNNYATVSDSFYDSETTNQSDTGKGIGLSTLDMRKQSTYAGWDFTSIWGINASGNNGYPYLRAIQKFVTYDGNGSDSGVTPADSSSYEQGVTASVYGNTGNLARTGYTFAGWNTQADGSGTDYAAGASFTMGTADVTLYAKWTKNPTYTVSYDANGATSGSVPADSGLYEQNAAVSLSGNVSGLAKTGYTFAGWNTQADGSGTDYAAGASFTMGTADVTLYAKWTKNPVPAYAVSYDANGATSGSAPSDSGSYKQGDTVTVPGNTGSLAKAGYTFAGWNTQADGRGTNYAAGASFTMGTVDVTLYAKWLPASTSSDSDTGSTGPTGSTASGNNVVPADGTLTLPVGKSGEVSLGNRVKVVIPADASGKELKITIQQVTDTQNLLTSHDVLATPIYEILKSFTENFEKDITLIFTFDPQVLKGNQIPAVFFYDEAKKTWVKVGGMVNGNTITVKVNHFTKFAVFGVGEGADPTDGATPSISLSDISGHWAETNIKQAVGMHIVGGYPDGSFKPNGAVTRAEFAVMLVNALKPQQEGTALAFADQEQIGAWAQRAIAQAVQASIIHGYEDGTFLPNAKITRAEMAVMISSALGQSVQATATGFADDKDIPAWAKGAIVALSQLGIIEGKGANRYAPGNPATRAEAVTVLLNMLAQASK